MPIDERYEILHELGKGGFGTTYAAIDRTTGAKVAVKVLELRRAGEWKSVELFEREARVLSTLDHPGIPRYVEFRPFEETGEAYLVQGLAPGESLEALLAKRRFTESELVDLTTKVLEILDYLTTIHPVVVHRDVKPANILLADDGHVSLVDFGAVRDVASATGGSTVAGTFGYMAPEQLQGIALPSSDLYALGMTLVRLATGRDPADLETKRLKPDFKKHVEMSEWFEELIDCLIEPVPDDRFPNAAAALEVLRGSVTGRVTGSGRPSSSVPSSGAISRMREQAERAERAQERPRMEKRSSPPKPDERVDFVSDEEGATLAIRPARGWRGREMHFALLLVLGSAVPIASALAWGGAATGPGLVAWFATGWLIWFTAPTWHLRITRAGDFALYTRSLQRPKRVGRTTELQIRIVPAESGNSIVTFVHQRPGRDAEGLMDFYPVDGSDVTRVREAARWLE